MLNNEKSAVCTKVEEASRGVSVESMIKLLSRLKDSRGAFQALIANHAGEFNHRSISKKLLHVLKILSRMAGLIPLRAMFLITGKIMMI